MPQKSEIGQIASTATQTELHADLSRLTTFSPQEIDTLFPSPADKQELATLIQIVQAAGDENKRKAQLIARIGEVAGAMIKITKKVTTGIS